VVSERRVVPPRGVEAGEVTNSVFRLGDGAPLGLDTREGSDDFIEEKREVRVVVGDGAIPAPWGAHVDGASEVRVEADLLDVAARDTRSGFVVAGGELGHQRRGARLTVVGEREPVARADLARADLLRGHRRDRDVVAVGAERFGEPAGRQLVNAVEDSVHASGLPGLAGAVANRSGRAAR